MASTEKIAADKNCGNKQKSISIRTTQALLDNKLISPQEVVELESVAEQFSISITPNMYDAMQTDDDSDPVKLQFSPSSRELHTSPEENTDPIGDTAHTAVKGIVHRYPDRCLLMPVNVCPVYCRFCFRREKVGPGNEALSHEELDIAYEYIREHPEIWEVILSGGDPLILRPKKLSEVLSALDNISSVEVVRIHTRVPIVDPERINSNMLKALRLKNKPVYIILHTNHANEFNDSAKAAIARLVDAGIPMLSQSVLLKGINDNVKALTQLMRTLIKNRVKPYYLHHGDLAKGTSHFRTSIEESQQLMQDLRGNISGLCQPQYVLDIPGGYGKVPLNQQYITADSPGVYQVRDYQGCIHEYRDSIGKTEPS